MAVRVNANSDDILYTAGTIGENAFTAMMWFYISVDRNDYSNIFWFGQDAYGDDGCVDVFLDGGDGVSISAGIRNYNTPQISTAEALAVGNWYHLTLSGSAATGQPFSLRVYRLSNNTQNTYNGTSGALGTWPAGAAGKIQLMMASAGSGNVWTNGRCQGFKIWNGVTLSDAQIGWERWFANPVFEQANCYAAWPLIDATDTRETMGTGRAPTLTGLQTEDGPPILWTPGGRSRISRAGAGTQSFSYSAVGGLSLSGAATKTAARVGTVAGGLSLSGVAATARVVSPPVSGGIALSGAASFAKGKTVTPAGGLSIAGASDQIRVRAPASAGGITLSGAAGYSSSGTQTLTYAAQGGLSLGGASAQVRTAARSTVGGIALGGAAGVVSHESTRTVVASGGITLGGAASFSTFIPGQSVRVPMNRRGSIMVFG